MQTGTSSRLRHRPTLLCIDDSESELEIRKTVLQFHGYRVLTAENAREGLELIAENKVDVVLLDYQMPEMNGVTVARKIRRISPGTHIILYSRVLAVAPAGRPKNPSMLWSGKVKTWPFCLPCSSAS